MEEGRARLSRTRPAIVLLGTLLFRYKRGAPTSEGRGPLPDHLLISEPRLYRCLLTIRTGRVVRGYKSLLRTSTAETNLDDVRQRHAKETYSSAIRRKSCGPLAVVRRGGQYVTEPIMKVGKTSLRTTAVPQTQTPRPQLIQLGTTRTHVATSRTTAFIPPCISVWVIDAPFTTEACSTSTTWS